MEFLEIYDSYYQPINGFIRKMVADAWTADDLTQDTFLKVQKNIGQLRDADKLKSWIYRIAHNLCLDHFRSKKSDDRARRRLSDSTPDFIEAISQRILERNQMNQCVRDKIGRLPEHLRVVLVLYDLLEYSHADIAGILDITPNNAKVRLFRARKALRKILEDDCRFERDERDAVVCVRNCG